MGENKKKQQLFTLEEKLHNPALIQEDLGIREANSFC